MSVVKQYLLAFNLASALGWSYVLYLAINALVNDLPLWPQIKLPLQVVQGAAALEVVHAIVGFVSSPVLTAFLQVLSRFIVLYGFTSAFSAPQTHWSLALMVLSWASVEPPRYLFYFFNLLSKNVPFPLVWLRYSLFAILYPTGITGEVLQMVTSLPAMRGECLCGWYVAYAILLLYVPLSPFMYSHMVAQRKKVFKRLSEAAKPPAPVVGIVWPKDPKTGERSTTKPNRDAWVAAARALGTDDAARLATKMAKERNWRFGYAPLAADYVEESLKAGGKATVASAEAALGSMYEAFEFVDAKGKAHTLRDVHAGKVAAAFELSTELVEGKGGAPSNEFVVEYQRYTTQDAKYEGKEYSAGGKHDLIALIADWEARGVIEPDTAVALKDVANNGTKYAAAARDKVFVLLGAGSAMGPLLFLQAIGATVVAVDINIPRVWDRLRSLAEKAPKGSRMYVPYRDVKGTKAYGSNMMAEPVETAAWINSVLARPEIAGKQVVVGGYAYLDGALHVQVTLAMDYLMASINKAHKTSALAFLCTPTDAHVVPKAAHDAAKKNFANATVWQRLLLAAGLIKSNVRKVVKTADGDVTMVDGIVTQQGPNYALAKRMQHWRCIIAIAAGHPVATSIAPSTATLSVVHNKQFAAAYGGPSCGAACLCRAVCSHLCHSRSISRSLILPPHQSPHHYYLSPPPPPQASSTSSRSK